MARSLLTCPICAQPGFSSVDSLRLCLVSAATRHLVCPVCQEVLLGLDKFTIHLFGHSLQQQRQRSEDVGPPDRQPLAEPCAKPSPSPSTPRVAEEDPTPRRQQSHPRQKQTQDRNETTAFCNLCAFTFADESLLHLHRQLVHANMFPKRSVPSDAEKKTQLSSRENIEDQSQSSASDPTQMSCEQDGSSQQITMAVGEKAPFSCHLCAKAFKMRGSLMVHVRVAHSGLNTGKILKNWVESTQQQQQQQQSGETRNHTCTTCSKSFKKEQQLNQHQRTHEGKQWECDVCSKLFTTKYFLKKHKRLHTGEMPYSCPTCNKTFTFQQSYHKHLLYHSDEKPHVCNECDRAFKELSTLHNHQRIHTGEKPFACETCGKCFRQRVSYLVHRRIHTGAMPYRCTACGKSFRYKVSQRTHKCPSQPPGTVVRQNGQLVERLLQGVQQRDVQQTITTNNQDMKIPSDRDSIISNNELIDNKEAKVPDATPTSQELSIQPNNQFIIFVDTGIQNGLPHSVFVTPSLFMLPQDASNTSTPGWLHMEPISSAIDKQNPQNPCQSKSSSVRSSVAVHESYNSTDNVSHSLSAGKTHSTQNVNNEQCAQHSINREEKKNTTDEFWFSPEITMPQISEQRSKHSSLPTSPDTLTQTTDFFSMVMTPPPPPPPPSISANLPSPSEGLKQLSLSSSDNTVSQQEDPTNHNVHPPYQFCMSSLLSSSSSSSSLSSPPPPLPQSVVTETAGARLNRDNSEAEQPIEGSEVSNNESLLLPDSISEHLEERCERSNTSSRVLQTINEESLKQLLYGASI